jgi:hypothetical protein
MQGTTGHAPILEVIAAAGVRATRKEAVAVLGVGVLAAAASTSGMTVRSNVGLPLERSGGGRDTKVLSVVREEACGACGTCEVCAEALIIDMESTASGEWSIVLTGNGRSTQ